MNEIRKDIIKAVIMMRSLPSALDLWLIVAVVLYAFDKSIPWFVWIMIVLEFAVVIKLGTEVKQKMEEVKS